MSLSTLHPIPSLHHHYHHPSTIHHHHICLIHLYSTSLSSSLSPILPIPNHHSHSLPICNTSIYPNSDYHPSTNHLIPLMNPIYHYPFNINYIIYTYRYHIISYMIILVDDNSLDRIIQTQFYPLYGLS